jgi:hypothetical protein
MTPENIPYYIHESMMARQERTIRRLWILCLVIFLAFVGSNAAWIYYESQFAEEVVTQDVDTGNGAAYVAGIGDIYGTSETDS